ncbi:D-lyxose/D-mannose family sugar isomerase [Tianweitania sp.]|uniref:D-lyxose/D-mannose family sugar isomerase n=1 Tax=Tianweitania sp. TaxID=2021634 RepID=UPI0028A13BDE|nr:D-lyxose/D-mannose family sugar isomerase [Tianweitania sp.]
MKRSTINSVISDTAAFAAAHKRSLPSWAYWKLEEYEANREVAHYLNARQMGWDVTDFGGGDFAARGLTLLCLRNGILGDPTERTYAEKLLFVDEMQEAPFHFHKFKLEDIINAGGGNLMIEFFHPEDETAPVRVQADGHMIDLRSREPLKLKPGQSVTVDRGVHHRFYGEKGAGPCLVWEVSAVNDDLTDNYFLEAPDRFASVDEDVAIATPLWNEIPTQP